MSPPTLGPHEHLSAAATALLAAADSRPQHVGVYLYCTQAADLLRTAGARQPRHREADATTGHADSESLIRTALRSLAALPPDQFALEPVVDAARAARRALRLLTDPPIARTDG